MYVCVYACRYVCMYACMHVCMRVGMYACMRVCVYACMHACRYVCMYACVYVCGVGQHNQPQSEVTRLHTVKNILYEVAGAADRVLECQEQVFDVCR